MSASDLLTQTNPSADCFQYHVRDIGSDLCWVGLGLWPRLRVMVT